MNERIVEYEYTLGQRVGYCRKRQVLRLHDFGALYPAERMESIPELRGTRAWIVVPRWSCDSTENIPSSSFSRSSMLMRQALGSPLPLRG
jgi:hypothetical protein